MMAVLLSSKDQLAISFGGKAHEIDTILRCKKTLGGEGLFQLAMLCECCLGRTYWFSRKEIQLKGTPQLEVLASQAEEYYANGVDIRS